MNPNSVLLLIEMPKATDDDKWRLWLRFRLEAEKVLQSADGVEALGENVFLISLGNGLSVQTDLQSLAATYRLKYRAMFLEKEPQWIYSHPKPMFQVLPESQL